MGRSQDPILTGSLAGLASKCGGSAPGSDKDAEVFTPMLRAVFGFVECGTVTPSPRPAIRARAVRLARTAR